MVFASRVIAVLGLLIYFSRHKSDLMRLLQTSCLTVAFYNLSQSPVLSRGILRIFDKTKLTALPQIPHFYIKNRVSVNSHPHHLTGGNGEISILFSAGIAFLKFNTVFSAFGELGQCGGQNLSWYFHLFCFPYFISTREIWASAAYSIFKYCALPSAAPIKRTGK